MKHYLIDSENVGDFWIPLLDIPADRAKLIVFYTKNSPHMSYDSLIRLKESDRTVTFIKCYEGTNALDFQLCSELGFLIAQNPGDEFIIVTNDTGYDAAVKYWRRKEYSVKRIAGKDSRTGSRRRGTPVRSDVAAEVSAILHKLVKAPGTEAGGAGLQSKEEDSTEITAESADYSLTEPQSEFEDDEDVCDENDGSADDEDGSEDFSEDYAQDYPSEENDYGEAESEDYVDDDSEQEQDEDSYDGSDEDYREYPETDEDADPEESDLTDLYEEADEIGEDDAVAESEKKVHREPDDYPAGSSEESSEEHSDGDSEETSDEAGAEAAEESDGADEKDGPGQESVNNAEGKGKEPAAAGKSDLPIPEGTEEEIGTVSETVSMKKSSSEDAAASGPETKKETDAAGDSETEPAEEADFIPDPEEITAIVNCIGMENLAELHNQLIQFYGDNGKDVYLSLKSGALTIEKKNWDREEKFLYYSALIFRHSDEPAEALTEENISEFASFLLGAESKRKNLNSLRYALLKHYGKEKGRRYYFMLKPYVKALNQM